MENIQSSNAFVGKSEKMTLRGYYRRLPERTAPKFELIKRLSRECGVTLATARNWCVYGMRPKNPIHVAKISEITGIKESELWED